MEKVPYQLLYQPITSNRPIGVSLIVSLTEEMKSLPYFQGLLSFSRYSSKESVQILFPDDALGNPYLQDALLAYLDILLTGTTTVSFNEEDPLGDLVYFHYANMFFHSGEDRIFPPSIRRYLVSVGLLQYDPQDIYFYDYLSLTPELLTLVQMDDEIRKTGITPPLMRLEKIERPKENPYRDFFLIKPRYVISPSDYGTFYEMPDPERGMKNLRDSHFYHLLDFLKRVPGVILAGEFVDRLLTQNIRAKEITLYLTGDIKIILPRLIHLLSERENHMIAVYDDGSEIVVYEESWEDNLSYHLPKRRYESVEDILYHMDLDCDAVALVNDDFVYLPRYELAVKYGMTILNPFLRGDHYNERLEEAYKRGYRPFVPGKLQTTGLHFGLLGKGRKIKENSFTDLIPRVYDMKYVQKEDREWASRRVYEMSSTDVEQHVGTILDVARSYGPEFSTDLVDTGFPIGEEFLLSFFPLVLGEEKDPTLFPYFDLDQQLIK